MRILNIGSLNLDRTYAVRDFVAPGETISALDYQTHCGGKGLNQSLALARAGAAVSHLGTIGFDGGILRDSLVQAGVDIRFLRQSDTANGHAVIQVDAHGQNCIIVCAGSNAEVTVEQIEAGLASLQPGDWVLLQNETSNLAYAVERASALGLKLILNPSPINPALLNADLRPVNLFILNETEARLLADQQTDEPMKLMAALRTIYPQSEILLTCGAQGAFYQDVAPNDLTYFRPAYQVAAVDTTAAGDTFTGYFLAAMSRQAGVQAALRLAAAAAALAVSRPGAQSSIPELAEVERFIAEREIEGAEAECVTAAQDKRKASAQSDSGHMKEITN